MWKWPETLQPKISTYDENFDTSEEKSDARQMCFYLSAQVDKLRQKVKLWHKDQAEAKTLPSIKSSVLKWLSIGWLNELPRELTQSNNSNVNSRDKMI